MADIHEHGILIIDFGGQTTQLIARRVREAGAYCEIHPWDCDPETIETFKPNGIVLSGGPESTIAPGAPVIHEAILSANVPVLGICYGMQALVKQLGGEVKAHPSQGEFGYAKVKLIEPSLLLTDLPDKAGAADTLDVWMSHGDRVESLPDGFNAIASSANAPIAAMANAERAI